MTTVVVDIKNAVIYSDSRGTTTHVKRSGLFRNEKQNTFEYDDECVKILRLKDGSLVAGAGLSYDLHYAYIQLNNTGKVEKLWGNSLVSHLYKDENGLTVLKTYEPAQKNLFKRVLTGRKAKIQDILNNVENSFKIFGSGHQYCAGAMEAGCKPEEAIKIASIHDHFTNDKIVKMALIKEETNNDETN